MNRLGPSCRHPGVPFSGMIYLSQLVGPKRERFIPFSVYHCVTIRHGLQEFFNNCLHVHLPQLGRDQLAAPHQPLSPPPFSSMLPHPHGYTPFAESQIFSAAPAATGENGGDMIWDWDDGEKGHRMTSTCMSTLSVRTTRYPQQQYLPMIIR